MIYPNLLKKTNEFDSEVMQVDRNIKLKDYYTLIQKTVPTFIGDFAKDNNVRIWRYITD